MKQYIVQLLITDPTPDDRYETPATWNWEKLVNPSDMADDITPVECLSAIELPAPAREEKSALEPQFFPAAQVPNPKVGEAVFDGVRYDAIAQGRYACEGCVFKDEHINCDDPDRQCTSSGPFGVNVIYVEQQQ